MIGSGGYVHLGGNVQLGRNISTGILKLLNVFWTLSPLQERNVSCGFDPSYETTCRGTLILINVPLGGCSKIQIGGLHYEVALLGGLPVLRTTAGKMTLLSNFAKMTYPIL